MPLLDLDPRWFSCHTCGKRLGFTFRCPHCTDPISRLGVKVAECAHQPGEPIWGMQGDDFAALTITPSVNAHGHWHGFITAGQITTV